MRTGIDTISATKWLQARRQVQELADVVLGEAAEFFLYRGKLYGEGLPGQYICSLLGSSDGCDSVLRLIENLDIGGTVEAIVLDEEGQEPDGPGRPVLTLLVGHLIHQWPNGHRESV